MSKSIFQIVKIKNNKRDIISSYDTLFDAEIDKDEFECEAESGEVYVIEKYIKHSFFDTHTNLSVAEYEFVQ